MSRKRQRVIGTTNEAVDKAEIELGFRFPPSFRAWILKNNGLGVEGITIFPIYDERDARKTWDSIVRNYRENWKDWLVNFEDDEMSFDHLLPFADYGTGDFYCFDYARMNENGEAFIVRWSHETGEIEDRAKTFAEFVEKAEQGMYEFD
ncbi:MAG: SMI1/KNR4 family protein [Acidobacteriota bacterium]|nr:SMI1/KNR4 family protein [Acidobacteriota bacterium]